MTWIMRSLLAITLLLGPSKAQAPGSNFTIDLGPSEIYKAGVLHKAEDVFSFDTPDLILCRPCLPYTKMVIGKGEAAVNVFSTGRLTPMRVVPSTTLPPPACKHSFVLLNGSCYKGIKVSATWPEALAYCEVFGAELAIIGSQQEQAAIEGYLATLRDPEYGVRKHHEYWFGANDIVIEGDWKWAVTMETINYTNWYNSNPDNGGDDTGYNEEHCAEMSEKRNWQWNDDECEQEKHFLCEIITEDQ